MRPKSRNSAPTAHQTRTAAKRRGDIAGHLGMAEMAALLSDRAVGRCDRCSRACWSHDDLLHHCAMRQPDGSTCYGTFRSVP